jgi:hypothetical protein
MMWKNENWRERNASFAIRGIKKLSKSLPVSTPDAETVRGWFNWGDGVRAEHPRLGVLREKHGKSEQSLACAAGDEPEFTP